MMTKVITPDQFSSWTLLNRVGCFPNFQSLQQRARRVGNGRYGLLKSGLVRPRRFAVTAHLAYILQSSQPHLLIRRHPVLKTQLLDISTHNIHPSSGGTYCTAKAGNLSFWSHLIHTMRISQQGSFHMVSERRQFADLEQLPGDRGWETAAMGSFHMVSERRQFADLEQQPGDGGWETASIPPKPGQLRL
jgi:hypothetical protein